MKILVISGHGAGDPGAIGNGFKEADLTREMTVKVNKTLAQFASVTLYPQNRNAYKDIQNGQWQVGWDFDYVLEIHFNAGGGQGTEIFVTTKEKKITVEKNIVNKLAALGLKNRGVKVTNFLVINTCKSHGISSALLETCFIDSKSDMDFYMANKDNISNAITNGIVEGFGLNGNKQPNAVGAPKQPANNPTGYTGNSLVDYLKSIGVDSSFNNRKELAKQYGIAGYAGTSAQNLALLEVMKKGTPTVNNPTTAYYPAFINESIIDGLKGIGVDSSIKFRIKIAIANGITNYSGTAEQNRLLCELGKQGKLKKS